MITIPACKLHNQDASLDDEFARNCLVVSCYNDISNLLKDKLERSFNIKSKIEALVKNIIAKTDEEYLIETGNARLSRCMEKIIRGIYFHEYTEPLKNNLLIIFASPVYHNQAQSKIAEVSNSIIAMLTEGNLFKGENPMVFKYSFHHKENSNDKM